MSDFPYVEGHSMDSQEACLQVARALHNAAMDAVYAAKGYEKSGAEGIAEIHRQRARVLTGEAYRYEAAAGPVELPF